jgi:hypothetical protein
MMERRVDANTGAKMQRELLGFVLYEQLDRKPWRRTKGSWDLYWQGREPHIAMCEPATEFI